MDRLHYSDKMSILLQDEDTYHCVPQNLTTCIEKQLSEAIDF